MPHEHDFAVPYEPMPELDALDRLVMPPCRAILAAESLDVLRRLSRRSSHARRLLLAELDNRRWWAEEAETLG